MKTLFFSLFILVFCICCGQNNYRIVRQSYMTGIALPENSILDQNKLDITAARMLLEMAGKNIKIGEVEVLGINKGFSLHDLKTELNRKGWQVTAAEKEYLWLKKDSETLLAYFAEGGQAMEFYIGEVKSQPGQDTAIVAQNQNTRRHQTENSQTKRQEPTKGRLYFDTTNWDDGWISQDFGDKVVVSKGNVKVYLYPPLKYDATIRRAGRDYYWDNFIAKQFQIQTKQYRDPPPNDPIKPDYIEGRAIDPATGKQVFLGFNVASRSGVMYPVLAIAPDENTFWSYFPDANNTSHPDLLAMQGYNKFAVSYSDLIGTWSGGTSGAANYYNAYTGSYQGMGAAVTGDLFTFDSNGNYKSKHSGATGMVGSMNTYQLEYSGKASVSDWEIILPNRHNGRTVVYNAYFEVIGGGRILHLQDTEYTGMTYTLIKQM